MKLRQVFLIIAIFVAAVNGRVYYMQNDDGNRYADTIYPVRDEQSSRDLDLSFSAGDPDESEAAFHPIKKVWTFFAPAKKEVEIKKQMDSPPVYYKVFDGARRTDQDDIIVIPEKNRKFAKINGNGKGEVILELRVIANHDGA